MLNPDEVEKLKEQEKIRLQLQEESKPARRLGFWEICNSQIVLWLLGSVVLGLLSTGYNHHMGAIATQKEDSEFLLRSLPYLTDDKPNTRLRAIEVITTRFPSGPPPPAIQSLISNVLRQAVVSSAGRPTEETQGLVANVVQELDKKTQEGPQLGPALTETIQKLPSRVYLQICDEKQRQVAQEIQTKLRNEGFLVPGIENVGSKGINISTTQVRFFNDSDAETAKKIQGLLGEPSALTKLNLKTSPGTLEIWLASNPQ